MMSRCHCFDTILHFFIWLLIAVSFMTALKIDVLLSTIHTSVCTLIIFWTLSHNWFGAFWPQIFVFAINSFIIKFISVGLSSQNLMNFNFSIWKWKNYKLWTMCSILRFMYTYNLSKSIHTNFYQITFAYIIHYHIHQFYQNYFRGLFDFLFIFLKIFSKPTQPFKVY